MKAPARPVRRPELSVIIPTRNRRGLLSATLGRLARFSPDAPIEVVVVDDGSTDGSHDAVRGFAAGAPWPVHALSQAGRGPAAARNRGIDAARGRALLFMGDDSLPTPGLITGHIRFHRANRDGRDGLLGLVKPAPPLDESPFIRWLHEDGAQFGYAALDPDALVSGANFWTSNVSVKAELIEEAGPFDEGFTGAACEDAELGLRLQRAGMRLHYDPETTALHFHPTDLAAALARMRVIGVAHRRLCQLAPEVPEPTRPSLRHVLKAGALAAALRLRPADSVRRRAWQFLCDEVLREAYWDRGLPDGGPRIGATLARVALRDPEATPPVPPIPSGDEQTRAGDSVAR